MKIKDYAIAVKRRLDSIDFSVLWSGFKAHRFALYDHENVYLEDGVIPYDRRFLGNTSIAYEGEYIAIWDMSHEKEDVDADVLTSNLVHEMFHAFQYENHDKRFPNDLHLLNYPDDLLNYWMKYQENVELSKALHSRDSFLKFVGIRKQRMSRIGEIINQEFLAETAEGLAEYNGTMALKQLAEDKYKTRIGEYSAKLSSLTTDQFDIRRISYYVGVLFFLSCFENGYQLNPGASNDETYFSQLTDTYSFDGIPGNIPNMSDAVGEMFRQYVADKGNRLRQFTDVPRAETAFAGLICGYDPMNMVKREDMILCTHFVMLQSASNDEPIFLNGPVLLKMESGSDNSVVAYLR
jgi:hypothetical protein